MSKSDYLRRYVLYLLGLYVLGLALALIIRSGLGTSPISSWAYVMSCNTPLTVGTYTIIINTVMMLLQCLVLRHHGLRNELVNIALQLPFSFIFGMFIDLNVQFVSLIPVPNYLVQLVLLIVGCFVQALGVLFEVKAQVTMMSAEALVNYICVRWHKEFGLLKVRFDVCLVLLAVAFSVGFALRDGRSILDGILAGAREGTVIAALCVGQIVRLYARHSGWVDRFLASERSK